MAFVSSRSSTLGIQSIMVNSESTGRLNGAGVGAAVFCQPQLSQFLAVFDFGGTGPSDSHHVISSTDKWGTNGSVFRRPPCSLFYSQIPQEKPYVLLFQPRPKTLDTGRSLNRS